MKCNKNNNNGNVQYECLYECVVYNKSPLLIFTKNIVNIQVADDNRLNKIYVSPINTRTNQISTTQPKPEAIHTNE